MPNVSFRVALLLGSLLAAPQDDAKTILEKLSSATPQVRAEGASASENLPVALADQLLPDVLKLLQNPDPGIRLSAVVCITRMKAGSASVELAALLEDKDERVRRAAAKGLRDINGLQAVPALIARLAKGTEGDRGVAAETLGFLEAPEAVPALVKLLDDPKNEEPATIALGLIGGAGAEEALLRNLRIGVCVESSARGLGQMRAAKAIPALSPLLQKKGGDRVRGAAAIALAELGARDQREAIAALLKEANPLLLQPAVEALGLLGMKESIPDIAPLLKALDGGVRETAAEALVRLNAVDKIPEILTLAEDPDSPIRRFFAVRAVTRLGGAGAVEALRKAQGNSQVAELATTMLGRLQNPDWMVTELEAAENAKRVPEPDVLFYMNRLRQPELWARLQGLTLKGPVRGTYLQQVERLAKDAGLALELPPPQRASDRGRATRRIRSRDFLENVGDRLTVLEALTRAAGRTGHAVTFILEKDRLRVVESAKAHGFWKEWLAGGRKR